MEPSATALTVQVRRNWCASEAASREQRTLSGGSVVERIRRPRELRLGGRWHHRSVTNFRGGSSLAAGRRHSLGLRRDGRVLATGNGMAGECHVAAWTDIVAVAAGNVHSFSNTGRSHTVGLTRGGTVIAPGGGGRLVRRG